MVALETSPETTAHSTRRWYLFPIAIFVSTRLGYAGISWLGWKFIGEALFRNPPAPYEGLSSHPWLAAFCRWDCGWFVQIARDGYQQRDALNFWPMLPLLSVALAKVTGIHPNLLLLIIPNVAALGGLLAMYKLFERLEGADAAQWGLALFAVYPFAFFQAAGYPEALMVAFSAAGLLLATSGRHLSAGASVALGLLSRHLTIFAWPALALTQLRRHGIRGLLSWRLVGLTLPALGLGAWMLFLQSRFGDPLAFVHVRKIWGDLAYRNVFEPFYRSWDIAWSYIPFAMIPMIGSIALLFRRRWLELASFAVPLMLFLFAVGLTSLGRYSASCWPAFLPAGILLARHRWLQVPVVLVLGMFQGLFFFLYTRHWYIF